MLENVYQSLIAFAQTIVPSGVTVVEGESYGVRYNPPLAVNPSVAIQVDDITEADLELGSFGTRYYTTFGIVAQSRKQRDALKTLVYSGCVHNRIPLYSSFSGNGVVASGATIVGYAEVSTHVSSRDVLDFQSNIEKRFWAANVFCGYDVFV